MKRPITDLKVEGSNPGGAKILLNVFKSHIMGTSTDQFVTEEAIIESDFTKS